MQWCRGNWWSVVNENVNDSIHKLLLPLRLLRCDMATFSSMTVWRYAASSLEPSALIIFSPWYDVHLIRCVRQMPISELPEAMQNIADCSEYQCCVERYYRRHQTAVHVSLHVSVDHNQTDKPWKSTNKPRNYRPPGAVVPGGLVFYYWCFFLFRHEFSELRQPIAAKLCHVIGRFFLVFES